MGQTCPADYLSFLPISFGGGGGRGSEGLKIVEMPSNYNQGTTTTHATLQVSQSLVDLVVTEISARNEIPIQSLLKIRFRNDVHVSGYLIYSLRAWASCAANIINRHNSIIISTLMTLNYISSPLKLTAILIQ